jgi:HK97 family phage portal protein
MSEKADRAAPIIGRRYGMDRVTPPVGTAPAMQAERVDSQIAIATRILSATIGELPIRIMQEDTVKGELVLVEDNSHPALAVLKTPTPNAEYTQDQLFEHAAQALVLAGNSYTAVEKLTPDGSGDPQELWPRNPLQMDVALDKVTGMKTGYHFGPRISGEPQMYNLDEMVHTRLVNINQDFVGAGRVQPVRSEVMTNFWMNRFNERFFQNGLRIDKMWMPEKDTGAMFGAAKAKELFEVLQGQFGGVDNAHGLFVNPYPGRLENMSEGVADASFIEGKKINREVILGTLGIPPMLAGILEFSSYSNALLQERVMWMYTVKPLLRVIANAWTVQFVQQFWDDPAVLQFDLRGVEALREDELKTTRTVSLAVRSGFMTPNEARARIGLEEIEGADELKQPMASGAFGAEAAGSGDKAHKPVRRRLTDRELAQEHIDGVVLKVFDKEQSLTVKALDQMLKQYFREQRIRINKQLDTFTRTGKAMSRLWMYTKEKRWTKDDIPFVPDPIFDLLAENNALALLADPLIVEALMRAGQGFIDESGFTGVAFNTQNPLILTATEEFVNRIEAMNETSFQELQGILSDAVVNGSTIREVKKAITTRWSDFSDYRALRIARTEATGIVNRGNLLAYQATGVMKKKWLATLDSKTRFDHAASHNDVVGVNESFTKTGWAMSAPGDPSAPAHQTVNCRCAVAPVIEFSEDE